MCALIGVARAEEECGNQDASWDATSVCNELLLKVAAVNSFFADSGADGEKRPEPLVGRRHWHKELYGGVGGCMPTVVAKDRYNNDGKNKKGESNSKVSKELAAGAPALAKYGV